MSPTHAHHALLPASVPAPADGRRRGCAPAAVRRPRYAAGWRAAPVRLLLHVAGLAALLVLGWNAPARAGQAKVSAPFAYAGYGEPQWRGQTRSSTYVAMPDGVRLAVDVVLPARYAGTGAAPTRFPVIFRYTPYRRAAVDAPLGESPPDAEPDFFVGHGYALVAADMRGTGASEGWMNQMSEAIRQDGKALVDWIAAQPWSTGKVGMTGGSYEGWSQLAVASTRPAALKAIVPANPGWETLQTRPGGILSYAFMQTWSALTYSLNRGRAFPAFPMPPAPPVEDEDGDGQVVDEVPVDLDGDGWFHDDYAWPLESGPAPRYADGAARTRHAYLKAVMQHHADPAGAPGSFDGFTQADALRFRDERRPGDGLTPADLNWAWLPQVRDSGVAIMFEAGWFDPYVRSVFELHSTLAGHNPTRLIATPAYHQGIAPAAAQFLGLTEAPDRRAEQLRWFDRWLKDIDNGIDREPPLHFFVMNADWRSEPQWPLPAAAPLRLYLQEGRALAPAAPRQAGKDRYRADFSHGSGWPKPLETAAIARVNARVPRPAPAAATFPRSRQLMFGTPEGPPLRTGQDRKAYTYTSAPLERDTDVIGHPLVRLWASSSADDGDFYFYLEDVAPDGEAVLVTEYQHRAGFDRLHDNDTIIPRNPGIDVRPELPWHGFAAADYDPEVFAGGRVAEVRTALYPTAWRFKRGHSIRLSIAAADWPTFELHPALSPQNRPDAPDNRVPTLGFHRGGTQASYLELPVAPAAGGGAP